MGSRSLQHTGAQMPGEMLVVGESSQAGDGYLLRFWGVCVLVSVCGREGRKDGKVIGLQFTENPFPICTVVCCFQFLLSNLCMCI